MNPLISVIIPTYNRAGFIQKAVLSVLHQTLEDFELLIIDDGSSDNSRDIILSIKDSRLKYYYHEPNHGVAFSRNEGIKRSQAGLLAFLDSDDTWEDQKLETQYKAMEKHSEYLISHTEEKWYKSGRILNPRTIHRKHHGDIFEQSLKLCAISMSTVMIKKELFKRVGLFDEKLKVCEDYDMWLRVTSRFPVLLIPHVLTIKQGGHKDQISQQYIGMDKCRIYSLAKLVESGILSDHKLKLTLDELDTKCDIYGKGCFKHGHEKEGIFFLNFSNQNKFNFEKINLSLKVKH
ncbi:MAG: glycosyltransferase family 2 protein [Spirochaetes bacterium]|nr:glycosyltransferase family 2 protein [Spirochaetota bacterium]